MKKLLFVLTFLFTTIISNSHASNLISDQWGVVVKVTPITQTTTFQTPRYKKVCQQKNNSEQKMANMIIGGLVGSVIGNQVSDRHGAGTVGALFGTLIGADKSNYPRKINCYEETYYITETQNYTSHYRLKVRTRNGYQIINSKYLYNVHDIIQLN